MLEAAFITQLDAAVCCGGVFIPAHHTAKPESCLERNPTPQPQHLTKREEGTLVRHSQRVGFALTKLNLITLFGSMHQEGKRVKMRLRCNQQTNERGQRDAVNNQAAPRKRDKNRRCGRTPSQGWRLCPNTSSHNRSPACTQSSGAKSARAHRCARRRARAVATKNPYSVRPRLPLTGCLFRSQRG